MEVAVMAYGRILRRPLPHTLMTQIDTSSNLAVPGVIGVLTGEDLSEVVTQAGLRCLFNLPRPNPGGAQKPGRMSGTAFKAQRIRRCCGKELLLH